MSTGRQYNMPFSTAFAPAVFVRAVALFLLFVAAADAQSDSVTPSLSASPSPWPTLAQGVVPWIAAFLAGGGGGSGTNFPASGAAAGIGTNALFSKPSSGSYYTSLGNNYFVIADTQNNVVVQVTLPPSGPATTFVLAGSVSACARNDDACFARFVFGRRSPASR